MAATEMFVHPFAQLPSSPQRILHVPAYEATTVIHSSCCTCESFTLSPPRTRKDAHHRSCNCTINLQQIATCACTLRKPATTHHHLAHQQPPQLQHAPDSRIPLVHLQLRSSSSNMHMFQPPWPMKQPATAFTHQQFEPSPCGVLKRPMAAEARALHRDSELSLHLAQHLQPPVFYNHGHHSSSTTASEQPPSTAQPREGEECERKP